MSGSSRSGDHENPGLWYSVLGKMVPATVSTPGVSVVIESLIERMADGFVLRAGVLNRHHQVNATRPRSLPGRMRECLEPRFAQRLGRTE